MRVDEAGHDDAPLGVDLDRIGSSIEVLPRISSTGGDDDAVARREPAAIDGANITRGRSDSRPFFTEGRDGEKSGASDNEICFHE
jgi:hypothetical protein